MSHHTLSLLLNQGLEAFEDERAAEQPVVVVEPTAVLEPAVVVEAQPEVVVVDGDPVVVIPAVDPAIDPEPAVVIDAVALPEPVASVESADVVADVVDVIDVPAVVEPTELPVPAVVEVPVVAEVPVVVEEIPAVVEVPVVVEETVVVDAPAVVVEEAPVVDVVPAVVDVPADVVAEVVASVEAAVDEPAVPVVVEEPVVVAEPEVVVTPDPVIDVPAVVDAPVEIPAELPVEVPAEIPAVIPDEVPTVEPDVVVVTTEDVPVEVTIDREEVPSEVPELAIVVCEEEVEVVEAATEAAVAEAAMLDSACAVECTAELVDAQTDVFVQTSQVVASMESFIGSPMSKHDALALQMRVAQATKGAYAQTAVVGSLESFGTDIASDDALTAGLEGLGEFLKAARNKLVDVSKVLQAKTTGFFKDAFVSFDKVARRADAVQRLAKSTSGESNASAIQLSLDTAWHLVRDGKIVANLEKEVIDLGKFAESVLKDNNTELAADRVKFIQLVSPLGSCELEEARKIAKQVTDWKMPKPSFAKVKIQSSSRTREQFRSDTLMGDEAIVVDMPLYTHATADSLNTRLDTIAENLFNVNVDMASVLKKPNKLDVSVDTLKPAEIVKIAEAISALLGDISVYKKTWGAWEDANTELDRLMNVLANVSWDGDDETYEGSVSVNTNHYVYTSKLNNRLADAIWYFNSVYGYLSTQPTIELSRKLIVLMNRLLEVCERSLATYNDNNLK